MSADISLSAVCADCGNGVDVSVYYRKSDIEATVQQCPSCRDGATDKAYGEGWSSRDAEVEDLERQVADLQRQVDQLTGQLPDSAGERPPRLIQH